MGLSLTPAGIVITGEGFNMLYIGHSFGRTLQSGCQTWQATLASVIIAARSCSAAARLVHHWRWENVEKRREAQGILDEGDIELMVMICCSLPWIEDGEIEDPGIINWMVRTRTNPNTRTRDALIDFPESYASAASTVTDGNSATRNGRVQWMRLDYAIPTLRFLRSHMDAHLAI